MYFYLVSRKWPTIIPPSTILKKEKKETTAIETTLKII